MPLQGPLTKVHAAASDDATVHGQPPAPAVMDGRGKERKRRMHEDAAAGAGVAATAARPSEINDGGDTGGARRHQHRRPRAPASEGAESGSGKHGHGATIVIGGRPRHQAAAAGSYATGGGSSYYAVAHAASAPSSSPRLLREPPDASPSPRQHKTAKPHSAATGGGVPARASSRYESLTVTARPNGIVIGSRHGHHQAAAAGSSIREPAAAPHHHVPKPPPKARGAPSPSASASAAQREAGDPELCYRLGVDAAVVMSKAALQEEVDAFAGVSHQRQQQPAAEAVETKKFSFWLTDEERDADVAAVYEKLEKARMAAAAEKRRRH